MENILLLHGALGDKSDLNSLAKKLSDEMNVHLVNFSGHGSQPFEENFGIDQFSNELKDYIVTNNILKTHVFGYSMGGYVALNLALNASQLFGGIITLGTKFNWDEKTLEHETQVLQEQFLLKNSPAFVELLIKKHGSRWTLLLEKTRNMIYHLTQKNALTVNTLNSLENTVLIGIADCDKMVSFEETRAIYKSIPHAGMYMLPNSKHPIESVNVEVLTEIIKSFIKKLAQNK